MQGYIDKCTFFTDINTFWVVQEKKTEVNTMNKFNTHRKENSVSTIDYSTLG